MVGQTLAKCSTDVNFLSMVDSFFRYNLKKYHIITTGEQRIISMARSMNIFTYKFNINSSLGTLEFSFSPTGSQQFTLNGKTLCDIDKRKLTMGGMNTILKLRIIKINPPFY